MTSDWLRQVETPAIVIDMEIVRRNVQGMQEAVNRCGCRLRPHIKTHKMPLLARLQVEAGACGVTCAKVSEAEVMADGGLDDIFIAYPMVGDFRIKRAIALSRRIKRLILGVDSRECADMLNAAAGLAGVTLEIRMEVDTGAARTGVLMAEAITLAQYVVTLPNLRLTGIYTFKGLTLAHQPTQDAQAAALEEGEMMAGLARALRKLGMPIEDVSAGSTPTGCALAETGLVNEIRPGTYILNDLLLCHEGAAYPGDIAARYVATVVSTPDASYAVLDGGTKTFPTDIPLQTAPFFFKGYAEVENRPDLRLARMNEEHGILTSTKGETGLHVGQRVTLLPIHVCTAINQQNSVYLLEDGKLIKLPVAARGMLV